jgi:O-antigen/teichoic acid export membrane protein
VIGSVVARNVFLNGLGQGLPLLAGIVAIPLIISALGTGRFGILALAWILLGYFGLFDLGMSRAATKFGAEALARRQPERFAHIVWTVLLLQAGLGVVGGLVLAAITPTLAATILSTSPLRDEMTQTLYVMAIALPPTLMTLAARAALESGQRFDLVNLVNLPLGVLSYVLPAIGAVMGLSVPGIVVLLLIARAVSAISYLALAMRTFPILRQLALAWQGSIARALLTYGGWVTLTSVAGPVLTYADRFLAGAIVGITSLAYYAAPFDVVTRLWIIPGALVLALFPAFSAGSVQDRDRLTRLYARAVKFLLLVLGAFVLLVLEFGDEFLLIWLGPDFAAQSALLLRILAVGVLTNSLALVAAAFLQGIGRPDIQAKLLVAQVIPYVALAWLLITQLGLVGAAIAWTLRVTVEGGFLFVAVARSVPLTTPSYRREGVIRSAAVLAVFGVVATVAQLAVGPPPAWRAAVVGLAIVGFAACSWLYALDAGDRKLVQVVLRGFVGAREGS